MDNIAHKTTHEDFQIYPIYDFGHIDKNWIEERAVEFDRTILPDENVREISFIVKDVHGKNIGGIIANTRYSTVYINHIWIREEKRKLGIGKKLIKLVEDRAKQLGCITAALGTFEKFGIKELYVKLGYKVVSTSFDSPKGHVGYWFNKDIR